ncbi:putative GTD-binding domain-containing protein [Helianthus anomalus]
MNSDPTMAVEPSSKSLKDALCAQQRLLQKLYHELDVEREAAATAASEAMSMILRLQGEKAAVKMEAEQYKRLAEEKMNYAEESMETFEEIMYQKEMEIAALDYQVQAYRYRLLSLGYDDIGVHEIKFPENLLQRNGSLVGDVKVPDNLSQKNGSLVGETSAATPPRRFTLPNLKKGLLERDRSITEDSDMIAKIVEEGTRDDDHNQNVEFGLKTAFSSSVDISSYLEQIRELDKVVEQVAGDQYICPTFASTSRCSSIPMKLNELDLAQSSQKLTDDKISSNARSPSVFDVFEVPQVEGSPHCKDDKKVRRVPSLPQLPIKSCYKDDEKAKKLTSLKKPLPPKHKNRKVISLGDGIDVDCHLALVQPNMTSEITNGETETTAEQNVRHEGVTSREGRELRLLYEINEKLDSIQAEIRSRNTNTKVNESSSNYDLPMLLLREVYLVVLCLFMHDKNLTRNLRV